MSGPEDYTDGFLRRWSQRKRAANMAAPDGSESDSEQPADVTRRVVANADVSAFDSTTLPLIESITATTDIRPFLAPGVPEELARAALRRFWVADPTIRNFIGLAENQWDFTKPDTVPGFGSLELTPELRRMVVGLFGDAPERPIPPRNAEASSGEHFIETPEKTTAPTLQSTGRSDGEADATEHFQAVGPAISETRHPGTVTSMRNNDAAVQKTTGDSANRHPARKHGGAVPK